MLDADHFSGELSQVFTSLDVSYSGVCSLSRSTLPINIWLKSHLNLLFSLHATSTCKARSHACDEEVHSSKRPANGPAQKRRFR